jgi:hypothetical protein
MKAAASIRETEGNSTEFEAATEGGVATGAGMVIETGFATGAGFAIEAGFATRARVVTEDGGAARAGVDKTVESDATEARKVILRNTQSINGLKRVSQLNPRTAEQLESNRVT